MGSDKLIDDISIDGHSLLSYAAARRLLAPITDAAVCGMEHVSNTNDVFRLITRAGRRYYIKFHTSPWYKEAEDTDVVVRREILAAQMLKSRGIRLDYDSWMDCTRCIVNRSVLVTSELPGEPLPRLLRQYPAEAHDLLAAFAAYLGRVHAVAFPVAGYLEFCGDSAVPPEWISSKDGWWNSHFCQTAANLIKEAGQALASAADSLPHHVAAALEQEFAAGASTLAAEYAQSYFVVNNLHPFHFHLARENGAWQVTGFYDLEVTASGNPTADIAGCDLQITPQLGGGDWRPAFLRRYGRPIAMQTYKMILIMFLLKELARAPCLLIPDPSWLVARLPTLACASSVDDLAWYPH